MHPHYCNHEVEIMDRSMMDQVKENYLDAVGRCVAAGFDMVMIHCAHGWLMGEFLSPSFNTRTDEYGGCIENRIRFPLEIIRAVKEKYGNQISLDMRVSGSPRVPEIVSPDENNFSDLLIFLKAAEPYLDMINISAGFIPYLPSLEYMIPSYLLPHLTNVEFAEKIKKEIKIPVSIAGSVVTLEQAESILRDGKADMVGMGRAGLADTDCFVKGLQGRDEEIRPCLRCVNCAARIEPPAFKGIRCAVNPLVGRELQYPRFPAAIKKRKIMIIGGGPAGMEASQRCTDAGHEVVLYEAKSELGGMLHTASALTFKQDMRRYLNWMISQTYKSGASIKLNTKVTPEIIRKENPDVVLIGIGSVPFQPQVPVNADKRFIWAGDVDSGLEKAGERVVIVGAGLTGTETAIGLAQEGKKVTVIDRIPQEAFLQGTPGTALLTIFRLIKELEINLIFNSSLIEVNAEGVVYTDAVGKKNTIPCDTAINALGMKVLKDEIEELFAVIPESYIIGDCSGKKMTIGNAVLDAFTIAADL
nr:FAD-dependent oxidoreductase [uncultured Clostridium sp.]